MLIMKRFCLYLLNIAIICSCQNQPSDSKEFVEGKSRETVSNTQEETNISEIRPQLAQMSAAAKTALSKKEIDNPSIAGEKVKALHLWSDGDLWPVMLEVRYPDNANPQKAVYYFRDRKLLAIEKNDANFIFKRNKLQVWADDNWSPLKDKTTDQWLDQENYLLNNAKKYLIAFDINYEE